MSIFPSHTDFETEVIATFEEASHTFPPHYSTHPATSHILMHQIFATWHLCHLHLYLPLASQSASPS